VIEMENKNFVKKPEAEAIEIEIVFFQEWC